MSQHQIILKTNEGVSVEVLMGWDAPCQRFYLVIDKLNSEDEPIYSNLYETDPSACGLDYFLSVLTRYGIKLPEVMISEIIKDKENNTVNRCETYSVE